MAVWSFDGKVFRVLTPKRDLVVVVIDALFHNPKQGS